MREKVIAGKFRQGYEATKMLFSLGIDKAAGKDLEREILVKIFYFNCKANKSQDKQSVF